MTDRPSQVAEECRRRYPLLRTSWTRAGFLFVNFLLIILALYQLKPASRSLYIEYLGAERLPYVWIGTALTMAALIGVYHRLVERLSRIGLVLGSCLLFALALILFRIWLLQPSAAGAIAFYIFVDILGVVLVEQFWSLTNAIYSTVEGKSWYGFIGTGGLLGGVLGGGAAALLLERTFLTTPDLLVVAALVLGLIFALSWLMGRLGLYCEAEAETETGTAAVTTRDWRLLLRNRYLLLIAAILLLAQLAGPVVEYQFLNTVAAAFPELEPRTAFLSFFFSLLGLVSIGVNLVLTPLIHRTLGTIAGLLVQPLLLTICSIAFWSAPTLSWGAAAKISDRGLSYSINRASRELLYVPVDAVLIYRAKAWIDMFGYRVFKIFGSLLILLCTVWLPVTLGLPSLSWLTVGICTLWTACVVLVRREYRLLVS